MRLHSFPTRSCAIWGTSRRANAEVAALANGVLLRCHDYNDLYIGQKSWGHPSDIIAALLALAEREQTGGTDFLEALAAGYDVTLALFDTLPAASVGWDYSNLTAIGAVCAIARLMKLTPQQTGEALAIVVIPHLASDEIESGDLNRRGDLTMWKRFNAGDAMRQAVYACDLARAGVEGAVRPFEGRFGFLNKLGAGAEALGVLRENLKRPRQAWSRRAQALAGWLAGSERDPGCARCAQQSRICREHRRHSRLDHRSCFRASGEKPASAVGSDLARDRRPLAALHRRQRSVRRPDRHRQLFAAARARSGAAGLYQES